MKQGRKQPAGERAHPRSEDVPSVAAYDPAGNGGSDVFLRAFTPSGGALDCSTYVGGNTSKATLVR